MKLFKVWQEVNYDYDTYDSMIICAESEDAAKAMSIEAVSSGAMSPEYARSDVANYWAPIEYLKVEYIGEAKEGLEEPIILKSFRAG